MIQELWFRQCRVLARLEEMLANVRVEVAANDISLDHEWAALVVFEHAQLRDTLAQSGLTVRHPIVP